MIFVDTSVWVAAFRDSASGESRVLGGLLDEGLVAVAAPVRLEILMGADSRQGARLRRVLSAVPLFYPSAATWDLLEAWVEKAPRQGQRFGFADLLIAAQATEQGAALWSLDADFRRMARLGFVDLYAP